MAILLILITLAIVAAVLTRAFRGAANETQDEVSREREDAKLAKYRELRELELDWRTGKLSDADYAHTRGQLRAEAATMLEPEAPRREDSPTTRTPVP